MPGEIKLNKFEERRLHSGHQWVFSNEISEITGTPETGDIVNIFSAGGAFIASGFYNKNSLIACRVISYTPIKDLKELFSTKLHAAFNLRTSCYPHRNSFRMVFSESDFLPGLIIDKYNNTFVLQVNSAGTDKHLEIIASLLVSEFNAECVITKNESYFRSLEGLDENDRLLFGSPTPQIIDDGIVKYEIDFTEGQKTGFYFDQCDNREFASKFTARTTVLDGFCNSGGFGLHALLNGASKVDFVDSSAVEIEKVKQNIELNKISTVCGLFVRDVADFLNEKAKAGYKYGVVMVDPPAFAKQKKNLNQAKQGYLRLNKLALRCVENNGFLVTSSCSYHLPQKEFLEIVNDAAIKEGCSLQLIKYNGASLDHPSIPAMQETTYLKFAVFKVLKN